MAEAEAEKYVLGPVRSLECLQSRSPHLFKPFRSFFSHPSTQNGEKRLKGVELSFAVITGTIAFSLGKKVLV